MNSKKFLILLVVLVGFSGIAKIGKCGTLSDSGMDLTNLDNSLLAWGDIDNDGDSDLAIMGWDGTNRHFQIYKNGANNKLTISQSLTGVSNGGLSFADYDRDGDLDLAITGKVTEYGTTKIYRNDGNGTFSDSGIELIDVYNSALAWGDYDNDGDLDLALIGACMGAPGLVAKIYRNKGDGTFEDSGITDLIPVASGSVAWGDYDNDGDLDLALSGEKGLGEYICKIYENDYETSPTSPFSTSADLTLTGVMNSFLAWGDYNNDGWLDIAICGQATGEYVCEIWKNDGDGTFTKTNDLTGVYNSSLAWGDYDNDGYLDLVVIGLTSGETPSSKIYKYSGGTFSEDTGQSLDDVEKGSVAWCDYDGDKDIDLALTGSSGSGAVTKIYKNDESVKNTLPTPPTSSEFRTTYNSTTGELTISWPAGSDTETLQEAGLYYNFRIGSESGKDDLVAARYGSPLFGNFVSKSTAPVSGKQTRTFSLYAKGYYWSVQAIDTGLGCSWSQEGGESGWSGEDHFVDTSAPPEPETPTDDGEYTYNTTIRFRWTQNNPDPETAIYNYRLQVRSEDGTIFDGSVGNVKSYNISGCEYNKTYEAHVKAQSGGGWSAWSDWSNGIMVVRLLDISNNLIHPRKADNKAEIKYFIINPAKVNLKIYNLVGELVKTLVDNQNRASGDHQEPWSGENEQGSIVASGIYLVHIEVAGENATEKICVVK